MSKNKNSQQRKIRKVEDMIWDWSAESITALGTIALAIIALVVAILEGRAMRKHNQLSVKPYLNIEVNSDFADGQSGINFELQNLGVGPAIVKHFSVSLDDKEFVMPEAEQEFKAHIRPELRLCNSHMTAYGFFSAIGTNERHIVLGVVMNGLEADAKALAERFNFKIDYQSIYENEMFHYNMRKHGNPKEKNSVKQKSKGEKP